jgi:redox-sensitive bicupin YhaK (pirin superfamily)
MDVWDLQLGAGKSVRLNAGEGRNAALVVLRGTVKVNGESTAGAAQLVLFERGGEEVLVEAESDAMLLWLSGEPLDEPIVGYGPFVMNSEDEIRQAVTDFNSGRFGDIPAA